MALVKVSEILKWADDANTCAIAFNCFDYNMVKSVVNVAQEQNKPVIIMLYPEHYYANNITQPGAFAGMVKDIAEKSKASVGLHLDHSSDYDFIVSAIRDGFTSVMCDGSMYSLEENIALTKKVIETAHIFGVDVEAELGHIGLGIDNAGKNTDVYTTPESLAYFAQQTNVDSVAVAIGSAHGVYKETPKLDLERLKELNAATDVPLVLHGGSGIPNDQLEIAFKNGINKINVGTEFFQCYYDAVSEFCHPQKQNSSILDMPSFVQGKLMDYLRVKMQLSKF